MVFRRLGNTDPITNMLSLIISHFGAAEIDAAFWSQQLSFWLAGIIVFGSVRGFFQLLTRVSRQAYYQSGLLLREFCCTIDFTCILSSLDLFNKQHRSLYCSRYGYVFSKLSTVDAKQPPEGIQVNIERAIQKSVSISVISKSNACRQLVTSSLGHIEFDFFRRWSDIIFVISSAVAIIALYVIHQTGDARNLASDFAEVEMLSMESGV